MESTSSHVGAGGAESASVEVAASGLAGLREASWSGAVVGLCAVEALVIGAAATVADIILCCDGCSAAHVAVGAIEVIASVLIEVAATVEVVASVLVEVAAAVEVIDPVLVEVAAVVEVVVSAGKVVAVDVGSTEAGVVIATAGEAVATGTHGATVVGSVIDVSDAVSEVVVASVVVVVIAAPVSTVEAATEVAEAVVDATVVADGGTPVSGVPEVAFISVAPVSGGPEGTDVGREHPGSVDPFIAVVGVGPVSGCPDIAIAGAERLGVHGNGGRGYANGDEDPGVCGLWSEEQSGRED